MGAFPCSRRQVLGGMAATLFAPALLSATRASAAGGALSFPHAFGTTVLPEPPRRVVSIGYTTQDPLLALDIVPVGIREWFGDQPHGVWPWAQAHLKGADPAVIRGNVSLEAVAVLRPDLIVGIGSGINEAEYASLSRIAPVLMQPPEFPAYGMPWDAMTGLIGRAVGREAAADEKIREAAAILAAMRARHPGWSGRTGVAAYHYGGETGIFAPSDTRGHFLAQLGFEPVPAARHLDKTGAFYQKLSPEDLSALEADLIFWVSSTETAADLAQLPMRRALKAHAEGREVFAGGLLAAAISFGTILSLPFAASELEADIAAAVDGDPATAVPSAVKAGLAP
ncbi:iron complex transport system substrate-binding protein [Hoeflea marina]|uniref:Iron complex transport system substrate-binding protein n=1 Tax=Hoeflea marina TaxID=274592 RepID=A0A317PU01_9HYPH|nr:ABC transporter substrate-binding protein [Hoeflea marina]PWW04144.1 iron complex transport system substrate-binding protein [Hoeflea marina]